MFYTMALHGVEKVFLYHLNSLRKNPTSYLRGDLFPTESMLAAAERQIEFNHMGAMNNFRPDRKIALYYSRISAIMENPDPKTDIDAVHELFRHLNFQVDYIDLEQIIQGRLKNYDMLFIQRSPYIDSALPDFLRAYVKKGGVVVMEGPGGLFDVRAKQYRNAPADMTDLFGASLISSGLNTELSFDDDDIKGKSEGEIFSLKKTDYSLKIDSAKSVMANQENASVLASCNRFGLGYAVLLAFPIGENYIKNLEETSEITGSKEGYNDTVGGISYSKENAYEEPVRTPALGKWFERISGSLGIYPEISRDEKDIEAAIFNDSSGNEYIILINHRNMKLTSRLALSKKKINNDYYDLFNLEKYIPRITNNDSILRVEMMPYQVRILGHQQNK